MSVLTILITIITFLIIIGYYAGIKSYVVVSGSMEPAIKTGSLVVINTNAEPKINDVVTFADKEKIITHRIIEEKENDYFLTKGDNNNTPDETLLSKDDVLGVMICSIPYIGYLLNVIHIVPNKYVIPVTAFVLILIIMVPEFFKKHE